MSFTNFRSHEPIFVTTILVLISDGVDKALGTSLFSENRNLNQIQQ